MRCECFECALRESESDECAYIVAYSAGQPAGIFPNSPRLFRIPARHHERLPSGRQCSEGPTPLELITRSPASLFAVRSVRSAQRPCSLHRRQPTGACRGTRPWGACETLRILVASPTYGCSTAGTPQTATAAQFHAIWTPLLRSLCQVGSTVRRGCCCPALVPASPRLNGS